MISKVRLLEVKKKHAGLHLQNLQCTVERKLFLPTDVYPWFLSWSGSKMFSLVGLQQYKKSEQLSVQYISNVAPFIKFISVSFKFTTVFLLSISFLPSNFFILPPVESHYTTFRGKYNIFKKIRFRNYIMLKGFRKAFKTIFGGYNEQ
jgi:hypothetical protein